MKYYDLKIHLLKNLYPRCVLTDKPIKIPLFREHRIHIDHVFSIPRSGQQLNFREEHDLMFESILNLRPLYDHAHLDGEGLVFSYGSEFRWTREEFIILSTELRKKEKYHPLFLTDFSKNDIIKSLSLEVFKETNINMPSWYLKDIWN